MKNQILKKLDRIGKGLLMVTSGGDKGVYHLILIFWISVCVCAITDHMLDDVILCLLIQIPACIVHYLLNDLIKCMVYCFQLRTGDQAIKHEM